MAIPQRIPVSRAGGNYSTCMGDYLLDIEDCQFWGRVAASFAISDGVYQEKRWYAILHKFTGHGVHLETELCFAGVDGPKTTGVALEAADRALDEMVAALGEVEYADIEICLFETEVDGVRCGLFDVSKPEEGPAFAELLEMHPGGLQFRPPWNGNYEA